MSSINPLNPSSGSTSPIPLAGTGSTDASSNTQLSAELANILRGLENLTSTLSGSTTPSTGANNTELILPPPEVSLNALINTLNVTRNGLSDAIQASIFGDTDLLQSMFAQYLALGKPGDLTQAIIDALGSNSTPEQQAAFIASLQAGTATTTQATGALLLTTFNDWLQTLDTKDRANVANTLAMILRLLPETDTPSNAQSFETGSASGGRSLSLTAATQTMTGPVYFRELIRALFDQLMQHDILVGVAKELPALNLSPDETKEIAESESDRIEQALILLITHAAALSNKASLSLLKDANGATLQNPEVNDLTKATSVLATFLSLLRPESINQAASELATLAGINLKGLSPTTAAEVNTALARFLQQALVTSGLTAFTEGLRGILSQRQSRADTDRQILATTNRLSQLSNVLNGGPINKDTLSDTLNELQTLIKKSPNRQAALTEAATRNFTQILNDQGITGDQGTALAKTLAQRVINSLSEPVTALTIQDTISNILQSPIQNPAQVTLTAQQQNALTHSTLTLAASVTTQQEVQNALIQVGGATAASRFGAQVAQVLYGSSVNLLDGSVTSANSADSSAIPTPPLAALPATGAYTPNQNVHVELGAFLLKLMEPATVTLQLASPVMYSGPPRSIAGDRNIGPLPNAGP